MNMVKLMAMVGVMRPAAVVLAGGVSVAIDATEPGAVLPNTSQVLTFWNGVMKADRSPVAWPKELRRDYPIGFARYAELMACTGGNKSRDLVKNPDDRTVLDDYDFGPLVVAALRGEGGVRSSDGIDADRFRRRDAGAPRVLRRQRRGVSFRCRDGFRCREEQFDGDECDDALTKGTES